MATFSLAKNPQTTENRFESIQLDEVFESFFRFKGSSMEGKTIRIDFSEQEVAVLHRAVFELQSRPSISPHELRAIQNAEQKILLAARLAGLNLHH
jgi:hypothetical protein